MGKKRLVFWLIAGGSVAAAAIFAPREPEPAPKLANPAAPRSVEAASRRLAELPRRETIGRPRGEAFAARSWTPPPPKPSAAAPEVIAPAFPPPMPYRVAGQVVHGDVAQVVLAKGDQVLTVREGEVLEGGYRVESIAPDRVTLLYVSLGTSESLPVASTLAVDAQQTAPAANSATPSAAQPRAAQLRWEGPKQVRSGDTFDVRLKVTSAQPVRASPLQLSFDAKLLQPINVRAGGFFADGMFSYRVNPGGSIFIGASGKGAVASDAEFLVVTFRTIGDSATAELKLSSLILQGAAGSAIVHDHPGAFRTAIVQ